ncbi:MAG: hypothetical protein GWO87_02535 [Xanthomonadaceae bacterium]|nr:hypothetical protein [Rhodospirillaceae bacterium]NIA18042.1 hypothetical protein [Xanthomonadaceae bacterium]
MAEIFIVVLIGSILIFFSVVHLIFVYQNKPKFTKGNTFWNYFRLIFSTEHFITSATSELNPFEVYCNKCKKDYSHISETNSESGNLKFLGIWDWAGYEKIWCFCGQILGFIIKPNK